ncbi:hypothetical protein [Thiogranum longum]|jgi:hypothetical protein
MKLTKSLIAVGVFLVFGVSQQSWAANYGTSTAAAAFANPVIGDNEVPVEVLGVCDPGVTCDYASRPLVTSGKGQDSSDDDGSDDGPVTIAA